MKKAPILKVKHKKNNIVILVLSLLIIIAGPSGRDVRLKAEHDRREKSPRMTKKKVPEDDKEERRPIKREPRGRKMTSLKTFPNKKYTPETVEIFFVLTSFVRTYI